MKRQLKRQGPLLTGLAVLAGAATLCLVLPLLVTDGGPVLWALLIVGVVATAALSSRAVWDALDDGSPHPRR